MYDAYNAEIDSDLKLSSFSSNLSATSDVDVEEFNRMNELTKKLVQLEGRFEKTDTYHDFRRRVFDVLAAREARMRQGKTEVKGAMLIGPAGSGKSRIVAEIIREHEALTAYAGNWRFGTRILSVVVPGRSTVKETLKAILNELGFPARGRRDEDYLAQLVTQYLKECGIAALHLDEVQDSGRYKTKDSAEAFLKVFRNMMQHKEWPVCIIMTATPEARHLLDLDPTLLRRLKPMQARPITFVEDGPLVRETVKQLFADAGVVDPGIVAMDEFIKILMHAAAGRFGVLLEMTIEAIGECLAESNAEIDIGHFADAYEMRMGCDDELNPFLAQYWASIDTSTALQRYHEQRHVERRAPS